MNPDNIDSAKVVKDFVLSNHYGTLSTHSKTLSGYPFGSLTPYDSDEFGRPIIFISLISEHYKNLVENAKASLCVLDRYGSHDPQSYGRATLVADFKQIEASEKELVENSFWARFPKAPERSLAHNFVFFRGEVVKVRWIGGFGDIRWVANDDFRASPFDPVAYAASGILDHMNEDHRDALKTFVESLAQIDAAAEDCEMVAVNQNGFSIAVNRAGKIERVHLAFQQGLKSAAEVRDNLISILKRCRGELV